MLARQVQAEAALHCREQLKLRLFGQHLLNQSKIREVILDVEDFSAVPSTGFFQRGSMIVGQSF